MADQRDSLITPVKPMLAQSGEPFDSDEHLFEIKWDGTRCLAYAMGDVLRLINRRDIEMRERYPEFQVLSQLPAGTVLDAEVVVLHEGKPSFSKLQQREQLSSERKIQMVAERLPATMIAFDLLYERGESLLDRPLTERRERLAAVVNALASSHVIVPDAIVGAGTKYFEAAEAHGLEGIMAKRLASRYQPGKRSPDWLKIKVVQTEVFEVIGFTPNEEGGKWAAALIIGEPSGRKWHYKGKVGSGFTEEQREALFRELSKAPDLPNPPANGPKDAVWKLTGLRALVRFFEKTPIGMLRAPVFKGFVE